MVVRGPEGNVADETDVAAATAAAEVRVPLVEEQISVGKHEVTTGRVRVSTSVETFDRIARADLTRETVEVTRVPIGEPVTGALPQIRMHAVRAALWKRCRSAEICPY